MSENISTADTFLRKAKEATEKRDFELAEAYTALAQTVMMAHQADKIAKVADRIDRLASVINDGKSWH